MLCIITPVIAIVSEAVYIADVSIQKKDKESQAAYRSSGRGKAIIV